MTSTPVYTIESFDQPAQVQESFTEHYNLNDPMAAIRDYARSLHQHTKRQMDRACPPSRGSPNGPVPSVGLSHQSSVSSSSSSMNSF